MSLCGDTAICERALLMVGHSQSLGEAAVPLPPFPSAGPATGTAPSLMSPAASLGLCGTDSPIWGPGSACHHRASAAFLTRVSAAGLLLHRLQQNVALSRVF